LERRKEESNLGPLPIHKPLMNAATLLDYHRWHRIPFASTHNSVRK